MCDSKADILKLPLSNDTDLIDQYKNAYRMLVESHDELGLCAIDLLLQQENTVMPKENASQPSAAASDMALTILQQNQMATALSAERDRLQLELAAYKQSSTELAFAVNCAQLAKKEVDARICERDSAIVALNEQLQDAREQLQCERNAKLNALDIKEKAMVGLHQKVEKKNALTKKKAKTSDELKRAMDEIASLKKTIDLQKERRKKPTGEIKCIEHKAICEQLRELCSQLMAADRSPLKPGQLAATCKPKYDNDTPKHRSLCNALRPLHAQLQNAIAPPLPKRIIPGIMTAIVDELHRLQRDLCTAIDDRNRAETFRKSFGGEIAGGGGTTKTAAPPPSSTNNTKDPRLHRPISTTTTTATTKPSITTKSTKSKKVSTKRESIQCQIVSPSSTSWDETDARVRKLFRSYIETSSNDDDESAPTSVTSPKKTRHDDDDKIPPQRQIDQLTSANAALNDKLKTANERCAQLMSIGICDLLHDSTFAQMVAWINACGGNRMVPNCYSGHHGGGPNLYH